METINNTQLNNENIYPDDIVLKSILGKSFSAYQELLDIFTKHNLTYEWRYYRDGKAWLCKVQKKNKTIVWMSAWKGYMQATIYFQEKHIKNILDLDISKPVLESFQLRENIGKSKPFIFEIKNKDILKDFEQVMMYKIVSK